MNQSPQTVVESRRVKRLLLSATLVGASGCALTPSFASAQQTNPFVTQHAYEPAPYGSAADNYQARGYASEHSFHAANSFPTADSFDTANLPTTTPVAQARLQIPEVHSSQTWQADANSPGNANSRMANLSADASLNARVDSDGPAASTIGHARRVHVGPDWNAFTPQSFATDSAGSGSRNATGSPTMAPSLPNTTLQTPSIAQSQPQSRSRTAGRTNLRPSRLPAAGTASFDESLPRATPTLGGTTASLASAAQQRSRFVAATPPPRPTGSAVYLASQTAQSQIDEAAKLFRQANLEYDCAAYASAETSAWQALEKAAQAIDLASVSASQRSVNDTRQNTSNQPSSVDRLQRGRCAIREARDFVGPFAHGSQQAIARLARAHQTPVVRETLPPMTARYSAEALARLGQPSSASHHSADLPTANEAVDRYLDYARTQFSVIAGQSLLAAQAMDLLAAIRLGRNEPTQLPGPTAICLRRAAVQGQSDNADLVAKLGHHLADVGLVDEARWALGHSLTLQPNPTNAARLAALNTTSLQTSPHGGQPSSQYGSSILAATRAAMPQHQPKRAPEITTVSPEQFASISHSVIPGSPRSHAVAQTPQPATSADPPVTEMRYHNASATTSSPEAPSAKSFFRAVTASFRSPSTPEQPAQPQVNATPAAYRTNSSGQPHAAEQGISNPSHDERVSMPNENDQRDGRISSRLLPGLKKWW
ncbi:MAG: hypothetical protein ACF8CQ_14305 [Rhodopirellula sp. JB044]|uniref:hypothetical protein n=1 Tax=Rhodopirellula sp. JB044 TaxID=3342844 RepID=UPI00370C2F3A